MNQLTKNLKQSSKLIKINYLLQNSKKQVILINDDLTKNQGVSSLFSEKGEVFLNLKKKQKMNFLDQHELSQDFSLYFSLIEKPLNLLFSIDQFLFEFSKKTYQQKKTGDFFQQLKERKKLNFFYGHLTKKEIIKIFSQAKQKKGYFSKNVFSLLERRLDVLVYRSGITKTIAEARQLIKHKNVLVNQNLVTISSFLLHPGDLISFTPKTQKLVNDRLAKTCKVPPVLCKKRNKNHLQIFEDFYLKLKKGFSTKSEKRIPVSQFDSKSLCDLMIQLFCTRIKLKSFFYVKKNLGSSSKMEKCFNKKESRNLENLSEKMFLTFLKWKGVYKAFPFSSKKLPLFFEKKEQKNSFLGKESFYANRGCLQKQPLLWSLLSLKKGKNVTDLKTLPSSSFFDSPFLEKKEQKRNQQGIHNVKTTPFINKKLSIYRQSFLVFLKHLEKTTPFFNMVGLNMKKSLFKHSVQKHNLLIRKNLTFRVIKPMHLEVSYNMLTIIYLYSPQRVNLPFSIDLDSIARSLR